MVEVTPYQSIPVDLAEGTPARPQLLLTATALVSASVLVGYMSLVGYYLSVRADVLDRGGVWLPSGTVIPLTQPNYMMLTLTFSVVTALWALQAVRNDDRANAFIAFGLTVLFGFSQLVQTGFLLTLMELPASDGERAALLYALIGTQLVLTGLAMGYLVLTTLRTIGGGFSARDYEGVLSATIFWIVTVGVYSVLWYAVYITK